MRFGCLGYLGHKICGLVFYAGQILLSKSSFFIWREVFMHPEGEFKELANCSRYLSLQISRVYCSFLFLQKQESLELFFFCLTKQKKDIWKLDINIPLKTLTSRTLCLWYLLHCTSNISSAGTCFINSSKTTEVITIFDFAHHGSA